MDVLVIKAIAQNFTLTVATLWVAYVWGRVTLSKEEMAELPIPIILALLAGWGLKLSPEVFSALMQGAP